jgi:hypothetical protein
MGEDFPLAAGDTAKTAMISLCAGGLVRTWTESESRLWRVQEAEYLHSVQGTGVIGRTLREERRFREAALLSEDSGSGTLIVQSRFPTTAGDSGFEIEANVLRLEAARETTGSAYDDVRSLLEQAIHHVLVQNEFLVVEKGGWDAPSEPFCLFIVIAEEGGAVSVIETAPEPRGSEIWEPHIVPGRATNTLSAPASTETIDVAPIVMMDAIATWGLEPWDLALTFGQR